MKVKFEDGVVRVEPPKRPKKITGTRFGAVLEVNKWQTPFQAWCEITKAWAKPFEDTIYTLAGKAIESKQLNWFSELVKVCRPEDVYGKDFFNKTYGDFFKDNEIFGGMWDSLVVSDDPMESYEGVIECKTTKRAEDWQNDIPEYYALQAALYAWLLKVEDVYMIVSFLSDTDYEYPEEYKVTADNTKYIHFRVHERYPEFEKYIDYCKHFWEAHVLTGISPKYDEVADKEYLDGLRTGIIENTDEISVLVAEAEKLYQEIEDVEATIKDKKKRLSEIEKMFKTYAVENEFAEGQTKSVYKGSNMTWTITKGMKKELDTERMKNEGIYDDFLMETETFTIRKSVNKEGDNK